MTARLMLAISKSRIVDVGGSREWTRGIAVLTQDRVVETYYDLMCMCLDSDVQSAEGSGHDYLRWLKKVEFGDVEHAEVDGNAWVAHITRDKVWFEGLYSQGEGGEVTFNQFKVAVEAYVRYLADPEHKPIEIQFPLQ